MRIARLLLPREFEYVNDGWRSILHESNIQDFLIRKFGFRKAYSHLRVLYAPTVSLLVKSTYPFRGILGRTDSRLKALYVLEGIRRSCK